MLVVNRGIRGVKARKYLEVVVLMSRIKIPAMTTPYDAFNINILVLLILAYNDAQTACTTTTTTTTVTITITITIVNYGGSRQLYHAPARRRRG